MKKSILAVFLAWQCSAWAQTDKTAIQSYLSSEPELYKAFTAWDKAPAGTRPTGVPTAQNALTLDSVLPTRRPYKLVAYMRVRSNQLPALIQQVAAGQLNKILTGPSGGAGTTSLVAQSVAGDVISVATEYGAINQAVSGNTTTLRGNLAGVAGFFVGDPYLGCTSLAVGCTPGSRLARSFSASISIDAASSGSKTVTGINAATGASATTSIFSSGSRMSAWGARYDFMHKTLYDTKKYAEFARAVQAAAKSSQEQALNDSFQDLMGEVVSAMGRDTFIAALQNAAPGTLWDVLQAQLDVLASALVAKNPQIMTKVQAAANAIQASFLQRDEILNELQDNKFSVEFSGVHPLGQPNLSNLRLIYSKQPIKGPLLLTFNGAVEWYDTVPTGVKVSKLRDVQLAAQLDRQLGTIPQLGPAVLTLAFYYQWMQDSALITIPAGNTVPGTGIILPGAASTLLGTKGNIEVGQLKVTIPIKSGMIKVPISFTWSNRTELINESDKRGQIGLTFDLDSIFQK
jgi:hypothetical protein